MNLAVETEWLSLPLAAPFTIARGTQRAAENLLVRIDDGSAVGIGAAAPSDRYAEDAETIEAAVPALRSVVEAEADPHQLQRLDRRLRAATDDPRPIARSAFAIALVDLVAKRLDLPLYRYWGLDPTATVRTSYTIGIDDPARMAERAEAAVASGFSTLKVKLGTDRDRARLEAVRAAAPSADIRVDANEGWTPAEAVETIDAIAEFGVSFVEQPVPAADLAGLERVHDATAVPIAADESCLRLGDVHALAGRCSIVTLKLGKHGGPLETVRLIHAARAADLEVMLGCMVESNAAIAPACHLVPLVDYADLDGSLLLAEDPYEGVAMPDGVIDLAGIDRPGTGARRRGDR